MVLCDPNLESSTSKQAFFDPILPGIFRVGFQESCHDYRVFCNRIAPYRNGVRVLGKPHVILIALVGLLVVTFLKALIRGLHVRMVGYAVNLQRVALSIELRKVRTLIRTTKRNQ